jgi:CheY-like chemotaxis protein
MGKKYYIGNVLVVDDQPVNLSLVEKILQDLPVKIIKATSGKEAIQIAEKQKLALILMDVQMPGMDGFETADRIKKIENTKNTPIIFVTAIGTDAENVQRGYESGAVDYIIKPVTPFVLRSKVQIFLEMDEKYEEIDDMLTHLEEKNRAFENTLNTIRMNQGLVPICSWCRKIKNDEGDWEQVEEYIHRISAAEFTHGVCPHCAAQIRGQMNKK